MDFSGLEDFRSRGQPLLARGPVALILAEDAVELDSTITHHRTCGFREIVVFAGAAVQVAEGVHRVRHEVLAEGGTDTAVNAAIAIAAPGTWLYYCYNAEYLFFPFCETRSVAAMLDFHAEERRSAMLTYVIDLYAGDLDRFPGAVSREDACLDRSGYYALARRGLPPDRHPRERQLDFFGGLRWRFEEHIPAGRRRIDRIGLFRARPGLRLRVDHTLSDEEMNTYACPWHNNLTAAICSFRTAKALRANPGSRAAIRSFRWHNSVPFDWTSQQLLDLGLIEPGQWF